MSAVNIVFDGSPGLYGGRLLEIEDDGRSLRVDKWIERRDGTWALRISKLPTGPNGHNKRPG